MWHHKNITPTDLLDPEVHVKLEKDHSDDDNNDGETLVKEEDHYGGDSTFGETLVKEEDHSGGDNNDGETTVKEEKGDTRHWVVSDGGFLNEIKKHHAWSVETSADENGRHVDNNISYVGAAPTNLEACMSSAFTKDVKSSCHPNGRETIHAGVKQYICSTCGKSFPNFSSHSQHKRVHTGEKRYACSTCGKMFTQYSSLKVHEHIHTGIKPYACSTCVTHLHETSHMSAEFVFRYGPKCMGGVILLILVLLHLQLLKYVNYHMAKYHT